MIYLSSAVTALIGTIIGALVTASISIIAAWWRKHKAENDLLLILARAFLKPQYDKEIARGYTTADDIEVFEPMYQFYNKRGGNGVIDRLHKQIVNLPTKGDPDEVPFER